MKLYSLKQAFDNRYKNTIIFSIFFIFGLSVFLYSELMSNDAQWIRTLFIIILVIILDISMTIKRYIYYYHLHNHGTLIENVNYRIIEDRHGIGMEVNYVLPNYGEKTFKWYRYFFEKSEVGSTGKTDFLIDLKHPKYYYIFR